MFVWGNDYCLIDNTNDMKKILILICLVLSLLSCDGTVVKQPNKLIERDEMISILYDISIIEAIKTQNINGGLSSKLANEYIYKKYKIDSIQLAQNNKYYAAHIDDYKKMIDVVKTRLNNETLKIEAKIKKN